VRHDIGLAGARDAEQRLPREAGFEAFDERLDRGGLIAGRLIYALETERFLGHGIRLVKRQRLAVPAGEPKLSLPTARMRLIRPWSQRCVQRVDLTRDDLENDVSRLGGSSAFTA